MKVGLVLEGGGMRGLYTAGVLDAFLEAGIKVDGVVSVSAGALFGVNYLSNQPKRALRYNKRFMGDRRYMSFWSWLTTGNFVNKEFSYYKVLIRTLLLSRVFPSMWSLQILRRENQTILRLIMSLSRWKPFVPVLHYLWFLK